MPTYSNIRPVKVLHVDSSKYVDEHMTHFFNNYVGEGFNLMDQQQKERTYKFLTDHESLLIKVFGQGLLKSNIFLPELLRNSVDIIQVREYKEWLDKQ